MSYWNDEPRVNPKVGDEVAFKKDIEGSGYVMAIREASGRIIFGDARTFVIGVTKDGRKGFAERWHRESRWDNELQMQVVYCTIDDIFEVYKD